MAVFASYCNRRNGAGKRLPSPPRLVVVVSVALERQKSLDVGLEGVFRLESYHAEVRDSLAVLEEDDGRYRHYAEFLCQVAFLVDVILADDDAVFAVFFSEFLYDGSQFFAGAAPCGPEIHEH